MKIHNVLLKLKTIFISNVIVISIIVMYTRYITLTLVFDTSFRLQNNFVNSKHTPAKFESYFEVKKYFIRLF